MFSIQLQVRDYECDIQGIVNNAIYLNYFEHARHQFLLNRGIDFYKITKNGINVVVYRSEVDYLTSLTNNKVFNISVDFKRLSRVTGIFEQKINIDERIFAKGKFYITAIDQRKKPLNLDSIDIKKLSID